MTSSMCGVFLCLYRILLVRYQIILCRDVHASFVLCIAPISMIIEPVELLLYETKPQVVSAAIVLWHVFV